MGTMCRRAGRTAAVLALLFVAAAGPLGAAEKGQPLRKKALALNEVTGNDATSATIAELLKDKDGSKKLIAEAAEMVKGKKDQPFNITATLILARTAHGLKDLGHAEQFYRLNVEQAVKLQSAQKLSLAYGGLIDVLFAQRKFGEAEKVCKEFLDLEGDESLDRPKALVLRSLVVALVQQKQTDKALDLLDKMLKEQPNNWLNLELKGRILRQVGRSEDSAKVFEDLIEKVKGEKRLKDEDKEEFVGDLRYQLSGVYIDLNQVDKAADELKSLLEKHPDNPTYNNDLGYIWADHDMNLAESEKLIRKALEEDRKQRRKANPGLKPEQDKDNAAYLDSLGWVLFKQKKYKEAKEPLLKAAQEEEGKHVEIYDHLAEAHRALGEKAEAVAAWKKALGLPANGKRDEQRKADIEKKLKANQ